MTVTYTGTTGNDNKSGVVDQRNSMSGLSGDDRLVGGDLNDMLAGGEGHDSLEGGGGADVLYGNDGNDILGGQDGADLLYSGTGDDYLSGGAGDDQINSEDGVAGDQKVLSGGSGDDWFVVGSGADAVDGGTGEDLVDYRFITKTGVGVDLQAGIGSGAAQGDTYNSIEVVLATNFGDTLVGNGNFNTFYAYGGNDTVRGGAGGDEMHGGDGKDTLDYSTSNVGVTINLATGAASGGDAQGDVFDEFENVHGSDAGDALTGDIGSNFLNAGNGNDVVQGGAGGDVMIGGDGTDLLSYAASQYGVVVDLTSGIGKSGDAEGDLFVGFENVTGSNSNDALTGDQGDNTLNGGLGGDMLTGGAGADKLIGGADYDTASYATASAGVVANLADAAHNTGDAKGDTYSGIEYLTGSNFADTLGGNGGTNTLMGGSGNDVLTGGASGDYLIGGSDTDTASYATATSAVVASLANDNAGLGDAKGDYYSSIENLIGSKFNDALKGDAQGNVLSGGAGADALNGGGGNDTASYASASAGVVANLSDSSANTGDAKGDSYVSIESLTGSGLADTLIGNAGSNLINAGAGNDILSGGTGSDKMTGGTGADTFLFKSVGDSTVAVTGQDRIFDFSHSQGDKVSLVDIDANSVTAGDQAFIFKGSAAFSGLKGELHVETQASDTFVYGDVNGDKVADFAIHFDGLIAFQSSDFLL